MMQRKYLSIFCLVLGVIFSSNVFSDLHSGNFGDISLNSRLFYFDRSFDILNQPDVEALTAGGILKYETPENNGFKLGAAYYASFSLDGIVDRDKGLGSSLIQADGDDISFLGEAYLVFEHAGHVFKLGRQRLNMPLINDHDSRMLPSVYESIRYNKSFNKSDLIEVGYINKYSGFGSKYSGFQDEAANWGTDGLAYVFVNSSVDKVKLRGQFVETLDNSGLFEDWFYLDSVIPIDWYDKSTIKIQYARTSYQAGSTSVMFGIKPQLTIGDFDLSILYNGIRNNSYKAVEAGPMYSDWQQGYGNYDPSDAFGATITWRPYESASIKLGYVDVTSTDINRYSVDDFSETNLDMKYRLNDSAQFRVRYSIKDQTNRSTREDRDDFRIIFQYDI